MSYVTAEHEDRSTIAMKKSVVTTPGVPLLTALDGVNDAIHELDQVIELAYQRLDHLILHMPEPEDRDTIAMARPAHSDTVSRVETLAERIQDSTTRLQRVLRLIEA